MSCLGLLLTSCTYEYDKIFINFIEHFSGQCEIQNLRLLYPHTKYFQLLWNCDQSGSEFQVTYQLKNAGQCDKGDGTGNPPFDIKKTDWSASPYAYLYYEGHNIFPNSTYWFSAQSRLWVPGSGYTYGPQHPGINPILPLGKLYGVIYITF